MICNKRVKLIYIFGIFLNILNILLHVFSYLYACKTEIDNDNSYRNKNFDDICSLEIIRLILSLCLSFIIILLFIFFIAIKKIHFLIILFVNIFFIINILKINSYSNIFKNNNDIDNDFDFEYTKNFLNKGIKYDIMSLIISIIMFIYGLLVLVITFSILQEDNETKIKFYTNKEKKKLIFGLILIGIYIFFIIFLIVYSHKINDDKFFQVFAFILDYIGGLKYVLSIKYLFYPFFIISLIIQFIVYILEIVIAANLFKKKEDFNIKYIKQMRITLIVWIIFKLFELICLYIIIKPEGKEFNKNIHPNNCGNKNSIIVSGNETNKNEDNKGFIILAKKRNYAVCNEGIAIREQQMVVAGYQNQ